MLGDTIAALATAPGEAGIALVRISGAGALGAVDRVFARPGGGRLADGEPRRVHYGWVLEGPQGPRVDECLAWYLPGPHTYTGEDVVEISCHGGGVGPQLVLQALLRAGARLAEPGEFTRRAFLSGRIDLAQAEATIDLVRARTREAFEAAHQRLAGELSAQVRAAGEVLLALLAEIEVRSDFPELELEELVGSAVEERLDLADAVLEGLISGAEKGRLLREGLRVVILGRPNVGKSSLLNALLGEERAIVSEVPGTTRDYIEESISIEGIPAALVDTAGVRECGDPLEMAGVSRTAAVLRGADLALLVLDAAQGLTEEDRAAARQAGDKPLVVVANKADLREWAPEASDLAGIGRVVGAVSVSAHLGSGLEALRDRLAAAAGLRRREQPLVATLRQRDALERALRSVRLAKEAAREGVALDLVAVDVRGAREALGEVTGETAPDAVLDQIFSRFCIGK